ncbi:MAG: ABC transporter ATP-binding protein [Treponema sp.]|nr:ABC transporter ATP-binding protein [Treponema sp.]
MERKRTKPGAVLLRLVPYYKPYALTLTADLLAVLVAAALSLALPMVLRSLVDEVVPSGDARRLLGLSALVLGLSVGKFAANFFTLYAGHAFAVAMERDLRRDFFDKLTRMSFSFFDDRKTGELMSRMSNDINKVSDAVNHVPEDILLTLATTVGTFAVLASLDPALAVISFLPIPLAALYSGPLGGRILTGFEKANDAVAGVSVRIESVVSGMRTVQAFAREPQEIRRFGELNRAIYEAWRGVLWSLGAFFGGADFLKDLARLVVTAAGGWFALKGRISPGTLVAFLFYANLILEPVDRLTRTVEATQRLAAGLKNYFEILDEEPAIRDRPDALHLERPKGGIRFENVTFGYARGRHVFRRLTADIAPGSTVALVGPSGAGKTTFCSLIPRFYEPREGRVLLDGRDVREYRLADLRRAVGIVQQDVFLFPGTVRENIRYGRPESSDAEVEVAARSANAHEFIRDLPEGYDTDIGERGIKLSGGQKQRLSIARAFLKDPAVLILDEATSSLDVKSEQAVQEALKRLTRGRTTLIIAHRLSTVRGADEILVLTEEGIVERGAHERLLEARGTYADLYALQTQGIAVEEDEEETAGRELGA